MEDENPFTKSQTIDPEVRAYVYNLVNALGGTSADEDGRYTLGDDALAVLRDLKRWLKLYDEKLNRLDVARCLAEAKLVTGDLLPILASWSENGKTDRLRSRVALACFELLVPLTWPLEHGEMTVNHHRHTPYLQQSQVVYKAGVLNWENATLLRQAIRVGLPSIAMKREERTARDEGIIKLMLYFLRNITVIRQIPNLPTQGLETEVSRSATIEAFRIQDVFALLLTMCSNMGEDFNLHDVIILEILFNLIKGVDTQKLWMTEAQRRGKEVSDLKHTLNEEDSLHRDAKKSEWSRHGRFGTMIWLKREGDKMSAISGQDNLRDGRTALFNIDKSKKWNKPQRKQKDIDHTIYDFDREITLTASASEKLRNFVEEFLDSGFNPLFTHLRRAIEREAERLTDVNYRQFFYTVAWFLQAERVRREKAKKEVKPGNLIADFGAESFGLVAGVLNQETFITLNRYMQNSLDNKEWQDLNASMRCFTQILLTVQEMAQSPLEEDQEIAENIQNRIFYEETTHDRIVSLLKGYKDQGFGYLDAVTELSHVFLRMLERYSKENADLQIRSRRKAKQKRKESQKQQTMDPNDPNADEDIESENEDLVDAVQVSRERKFDFKRFAAKFTTQSSVDTFATFITFFKDLSPEQHKRAHRFFYRVAFKQEMAILLYRVDFIALFYKIVQGPEGLSRKHPMYAEWAEFTKQLLRRLFKKLDQRPELFVELIFSKINKTLYYLEHGHDKVINTSTRAPAELEIEPSLAMSRQEQIGILVTILIKDEKQSLVAWVKSIVNKAFDERVGWEAEAEARKADMQEGEVHTEESTTAPQQIIIRPSTADIQTAIFRNARLRLLLKLIGCERISPEDTIEATWAFTGEVTASHLQESKSAIAQYEINPWTSSNPEEVPEDMMRRVRSEAASSREAYADGEAIRDGFIDDSEGEDNVNLDDEFMFPDNLRAKPKRSLLDQLKAKRQRKRKRDSGDGEDDDKAEVDDELAAERRKARQMAALDRRRKIKSELYIRDSDDESDVEKDKEFFAKEEQIRKKQAQLIKHQISVASSSTTQSKKKSSKKQKLTPIDSESDEEDELMHEIEEEAEDTAPSSQTVQQEDSAISDQEEETPLSSPHQSDNEDNGPALKELTQPRARKKVAEVGKRIITEEAADGDISDQDEPISKLQASARRRGGFIIDSDDEDE